MEKSFRRLANKKRRRAYVHAELVNGVAHQIRVLRQQRKWTQQQLAKRLGTSQTVVSRLEDPSYGKFSVQTLLNVGSAFDVAVLVRYMPFSEFMLHTWDTSPSRFEAVAYDEDAANVGFAGRFSGPSYLKLEATLPASSNGIVVSETEPRAQAAITTSISSGPTFFGRLFDSQQAHQK
jgi:transcriptional regulator with XRE-family HTH domain